MTKIIGGFFLMILSFQLFAQQQEAEIQVQDTLFFSDCNGSSFKYIDFYKKSRIEEGDTFNYDTLFFWDFYNTFFELGDFDVSRLPCSFKNDFAIVKHIMALKPTDGSSEEPKTIVIAMFPDKISAAYIIEDAFVEGEIIFVPKK